MSPLSPPSLVGVPPFFPSLLHPSGLRGTRSQMFVFQKRALACFAGCGAREKNINFLNLCGDPGVCFFVFCLRCSERKKLRTSVLNSALLLSKLKFEVRLLESSRRKHGSGRGHFCECLNVFLGSYSFPRCSTYQELQVGTRKFCVFPSLSFKHKAKSLKTPPNMALDVAFIISGVMFPLRLFSVMSWLCVCSSCLRAATAVVVAGAFSSHQVWSGSAFGCPRRQLRSLGLLAVRALPAFADRYSHSFQFWRVVRKSNFTVSALPDRIQLENLEASATLKMERHVVTRGSWQLGEIRRGADAMMDVNIVLDSTGFSDKSSWKRIGWIGNLSVFE